MSIITLSILPADSQSAILQLAGIAGLEYAAVAVATAVDLWSGLRRARRLNRPRTSRGFRRTVTKLSSYLVLMLMLTVTDAAVAAGCAFLRAGGMNVPPPFLWLTSLGAAAHVMIEAKSVAENLEHGPQLRDMIRKIASGYRRLRGA